MWLQAALNRSFSETTVMILKTLSSPKSMWLGPKTKRVITLVTPQHASNLVFALLLRTGKFRHLGGLVGDLHIASSNTTTGKTRKRGQSSARVGRPPSRQNYALFRLFRLKLAFTRPFARLFKSRQFASRALLNYSTTYYTDRFVLVRPVSLSGSWFLRSNIHLDESRPGYSETKKHLF